MIKGISIPSSSVHLVVFLKERKCRTLSIHLFVQSILDAVCVKKTREEDQSKREGSVVVLAKKATSILLLGSFSMHQNHSSMVHLYTYVSRFLPPSSVPLTDLQCSIILCSNFTDRPLETPCKKIVCSMCISGLIIPSDLAEFSCPSCKEIHDITETSFPPASEVVIKVLGGLLINCDVCNSVVSLRSLKSHTSSGCTTVATYLPSKLTVRQITSRPLYSPPTEAERKAATNIVRWILASNSPPGPSNPSLKK